MRFRSALAGAALALIAASALAAREQHDAGAPLPGTSLYNLDETWVNQDGARVALASLRGKIVVAAMGYTTCKDMCPAIVADMMWIDRHLPPGAASRAQFVFFTFDSVADSPERLKLYAEGHGLDMSRWMLLGADEDAVRELAAALGVGWRPDGAGGYDHAAVISLLDADGDIVFQQRGTQASSDELLARLIGLLTKADRGSPE
jgi:protein SCO1/2